MMELMTLTNPMMKMNKNKIKFQQPIKKLFFYKTKQIIQMMLKITRLMIKLKMNSPPKTLSLLFKIPNTKSPKARHNLILNL
jgi:hypothetical protein